MIKLKELRVQKGYSQEELCERSGISIRTIQRVEKGGSEPRGTTRQLLCQALDIPVEDLHDLAVLPDEKTVDGMSYILVLVGIVVPLGNIIAPLIFWINNRKKSLEILTLGKHVVYNQIIYTLLSIVLVVTYVIGKINHVENMDYLMLTILFLGIVNYGISVYAYFSIEREGNKIFYYPLFKKER
ncbi:helix-turn-helix domain-containing protein [Myroides pelagicus]|uniref:Helix-turn-helix domain-containing protein n=1 Tax=Myroides pelagicus TaxID=270914 RepID=A0A7K1GL33_9FLAO|nr:helix-turn-helix domain-containing protein [Myroides pelagicus]MEC4113988.1 helix-turn-helix domain-containing protein [Myroides pelagicus]MTH29595.1 helix-turn-helix domain-containing protein [Myroides pelagicus]